MKTDHVAGVDDSSEYCNAGFDRQSRPFRYSKAHRTTNDTCDLTFANSKRKGAFRKETQTDNKRPACAQN